MVFHAIRRHLHPARYQLVQEILIREQRGEPLDLESGSEGAKDTRDQIKGIMARASRLVQRKVLRQAGSGKVRHTGFVPPYNTQSRVFDSNELRHAATQVSLLQASQQGMCACVYEVSW